MVTSIEEYVEGLEKSKIPIREYLKLLPGNECKYSGELLEMMNGARINKDEALLEYLLLVADRDGLNESYVDLFCLLLKENWHHSHEDIIMMLEDIKDPEGVECIYRAAFIELDYDDSKSLAKKCVWALGEINTTDAIERLKLLSMSENDIIREAATMQLRSQRI